MQRRLAVAMLFMALLSCFAASSASGATSHDGYGLFVADDDWDFVDPAYPMPSLGDAFAKLQPRVFRLQTIWNTMDRPEWQARTHALIDRARLRGAQQVILTVRSNNPANVGPDGYFPSSTQYKNKISLLVAEFAGKVDVWGPANEPNGKWRPDDAPGGYAQLTPTYAAAYFLRMREAVAQHDPTALVTSPDFLDDWGTLQQFTNYVTAFGQGTGGLWGDYVAFHAYRDVKQMNLDRTNALVSVIPANKTIWITEVGAHYESDQDQNTRVGWIASTLAGHARVGRIAYYNMRGGGSSWDTGLLNSDFIRRPAWYTWCSATHADNPNHADCAPDKSVAGDWDGDGSDTVGVYRPSSGTWFLRNSNSYGAATTFQYGFEGALPIVGDWDGNGTDTIGLYYPPTSTWYLRNSNSPGAADHIFQYGSPYAFQGLAPTVGDWDGNGTDTVGLYAASAATWYLRNSNSAGTPSSIFQYGFQGTTPVTEDWDGNGTDTVGIFDPSNSTWYLRNSNSNGAATVVQYGFAGTTPVAGDWNNDGADSIGLYDPRPTVWYLRNSNSAGPADNVFHYGGPS
jgi:hypothetical protein